MARLICSKPCLESKSIKIPIPVPVPNVSIEGGMDISLQANCDGCQASVRLLLQIQPFLHSLMVPMCIFQCLWSLLSCVRKVAGPAKFGLGSLPDIKPLFDPLKQPKPPTNPQDLLDTDKLLEALPFINLTKEVLVKAADPTDKALLERMEDVALKCQCLFDWLDVFKWICMVKGIILLLISVMNCLISILQHMLSISIQITGLSMSSDISLRQTAECLQGIMQNQMSNLSMRLSVFTILLQITAKLLQAMLDTGIVPSDMQSQVQSMIVFLESLAGGGSGGADGKLQELLNALKDSKEVGTIISLVSIIRCELERLYCILDMPTSSICNMGYTPKDPCPDIMFNPTYCVDKYKL